MTISGDDALKAKLEGALTQGPPLLLRHSDGAALLRVLHDAAAAGAGMKVLGYDGRDMQADISRRGPGPVERVAVIREEMADDARRTVAQAIRNGEVTVLYAPWSRLAEERFVRFLHGQPIGFVVLYSAGKPDASGEEALLAVLTQHRQCVPDTPVYWACALQQQESLETREIYGQFPVRIDLEERSKPETPEELFSQGLDSGTAPRVIAESLNMTEGDSVGLIEGYIKSRGISNPMRWVSTEEYLRVSTAAASAENYSLAFHDRIRDADTDRLSMALVLACLRERQSLRP